MSSEPPRASAEETQVELPWPDDRLAGVLPWPQPDANKYTRGKLVLVAGSARYPGAACLAAHAAQRSGAGYVELVADSPEVRNLVLGRCPSAVALPASSYDFAQLGFSKPGHPRAACVGPGFDAQDSLAAELVERVLESAACPVLVDGGGLAALGERRVAQALAGRARRGVASVLTPHAGEAARLARAFDCADALDAAPAQQACRISQATGAVVVLKGPDTYVSDGLRTWPMREGTAALAKAGTGDVLAGVVASLLAQGVEPVAACLLGATLHARAGIDAAGRLTSISATPEDVVDSLPAAIRALSACGQRG